MLRGLHNANYTPPQIQKEALTVSRNGRAIITEVKESEVFALLADDNKDVGKVKQMCFVLSY